MSEDSFEDYLEKFKEVVAKLLWADVSVNAEKHTFCMDTI